MSTVVGSLFSRRRSGFQFYASLGSAMDSIFAIGFGLGLRYVVAQVTHNDLKVSGTLVGLWEGIILQHFIQKMPNSFDPHVAFAVRIFIDLLITESIARMVLILVWTGLGMVLADVTPGIWADTGMRRIWSRFRRDIYVLSRSLPPIPFTTKPRVTTVRFSPPRRPSVATDSAQSTSAISEVSEATGIPRAPPTPAPPRRRSRLVPGAFESETETDRGSVLTIPATDLQGTTRGFAFTTIPPTDSAISTDHGVDDDDDMYGSSSESVAESTSTERQHPGSIHDLPEILVEPEVVIENLEHTPLHVPFHLPPTPSDSHIEPPEERVPTPPTADLRNIPDDFGDIGEGWERVNITDVPPDVPPKDLEPPVLKKGKKKKVKAAASSGTATPLPKLEDDKSFSEKVVEEPEPQGDSPELIDMNGPSADTAGPSNGATSSIWDIAAADPWGTGASTPRNSTSIKGAMTPTNAGVATPTKTGGASTPLPQPEPETQPEVQPEPESHPEAPRLRTPPPAFTELYPTNALDEDIGSGVQDPHLDFGADPVPEPEPEQQEVEVGDGYRSPSPGLTTASETSDTPVTLTEALALHKKLKELRDRHKELNRQMNAAKSDKAEDVVLARAASIRDVDKQIRLAERKANSVLKPGEDQLSGDVDVVGLGSTAAVEIVEERIAKLLAPRSGFTDEFFDVKNGAPNKKSRASKTAILNAMMSHQIETESPVEFPRIIRIVMPK